MRDVRLRGKGGRREGTAARHRGARRRVSAKSPPGSREGKRPASPLHYPGQEAAPPVSCYQLQQDEDLRHSGEGRPLLSVIIPVMNERRTLPAVLRQAARIHPRTEIIVVANGSRDGSAELASRLGAKVISYREPLGHDVGRSIGASAAQGDVLLFLDGDMAISARQLRPFVTAIVSGRADVALNHYSGPVHKTRVHPVVLAKHALNEMLGRPELKGTSMTAIPHALSRRALSIIGTESLMIPPLAHAKAVKAGLTIALPARVDVGSRNKPRRQRERIRPLHRLIIGDHLEAMCWLSSQSSPPEAGAAGAAAEEAGRPGSLADSDRQLLMSAQDSVQGGELS